MAWLGSFYYGKLTIEHDRGKDLAERLLGLLFRSATERQRRKNSTVIIGRCHIYKELIGKRPKRPSCPESHAASKSRRTKRRQCDLPCQRGSSSRETPLLTSQSRPINVVSRVLTIGEDTIASTSSVSGSCLRNCFSRDSHCFLPKSESSGSGMS